MTEPTAHVTPCDEPTSPAVQKALARFYRKRMELVLSDYRHALLGRDTTKAATAYDALLALAEGIAEMRLDASPRMDPDADRGRVLALARRAASKYRHNEAPDKLPVYEFLPHHLMDFVDKVRALDVKGIDGPRRGPVADGSQKPNDAAAIPCAKAGSNDGVLVPGDQTKTAQTPMGGPHGDD